MNETQGSLKQYFANIREAVTSVSKGMGITFRAFLKSNGMRKQLGSVDYGAGPVTVSYPEVKDDIPLNSRNRLFNHVEGCIACNQCAVICPVECITIDSRKKTADIDEALCCFCGLCTEVCPTECIVHTPEFEYSKYDRDKLTYDYLNFKDDNPLPKG